MNVVFENVWKENDHLLFENQLMLLANLIIEKKLYNQYSCSIFDRDIGHPVTNNGNWCGTGKMLTIDSKGDFYPCIRFTPFSLAQKPGISIGNCNSGFDYNRIRPFIALDMATQSSAECRECDIASGCAWCQGANYDCADSETIFQRATYLCKFHKSRVRVNQYFWKLVDSETRASH